MYKKKEGSDRATEETRCARSAQLIKQLSWSKAPEEQTENSHKGEFDTQYRIETSSDKEVGTSCTCTSFTCVKESTFVKRMNILIELNDRQILYVVDVLQSEHIEHMMHVCLLNCLKLPNSPKRPER